MRDRYRSLKDAIENAKLQNGMRISFHHHLRYGDRVLEQVLHCLTEMGYKDLTACFSSLLGSSCGAVLDAVTSGVISRIETTGVKEPLGTVMLRGELPAPIIFRSHGGRARAITTGETPIDVAFIAASAIDDEGNMSGYYGPNAFGSLGYALVDADNANHVIGITDYLIKDKLTNISIPGDLVESVVVLESIGVRGQMTHGSLRSAITPLEHVIAAKTLKLLTAARLIRHKIAFQAGSGGISLAVSRMLHAYMQSNGIIGSFACGGVTETLVTMLKAGLIERLYDVQSFDRAVLSFADRTNFHEGYHEISASRYANMLHPGGCIAETLDLMILSATEVDLTYQVNSLTGSDGRVLGALGGAPDTAAGAKTTVVVIPSFRGRIPSIHPAVRTVCTPGSSVDMVITERGFSVNPCRDDLIAALFNQGYRSVSMLKLMEETFKITGTPQYEKPDYSHVVGLVEYRDGTILDHLYRMPII